MPPISSMPPPAPADREAHAAPGAIELSVGRERLIVNCGGYAGDDPRWRAAMRSTAAHSTLCLAPYCVHAKRCSRRGNLSERRLCDGQGEIRTRTMVLR